MAQQDVDVTHHGASDVDVIDAVLRGDPDRYAELVTRYQRAAWKLAYTFVGNFEDAKDVSQNGFVKAYLRLKQFRKDAKFSTWLYRIIVNECKDFLKSKARQPRTVVAIPDAETDDPVLFEVPDPGRDPSEHAANRELAKTLAAAIERLPMKQRTAFVLHHLQGMPLEDVSTIMGCGVGTVKTHVFRATQHLRGAVEPFTVTAEVR